MPDSRHRRAHREADPTPEGEALYELMVQLPRLYSQLQTSARRGKGSANWGGGLWGLLRTLKLDGSRTVPQIARARDVARQRIQSLVDEAAAAGLVDLRENPDHRRSRIVVLTAKGGATFEALDTRIRHTAEGLAESMDIRDLDAALRVMFDLSERLRRGRS